MSAALLLSLLGKTEDKRPRVEPKITILSTMLTEFRGIGEWGFAAVVEFEGRKLLFDTGGRPDTVIKNAKELGVDLGDVETVILSHNHWDHTGGLTALRRKLQGDNPAAMGQAHVGKGMFLPRKLDESALAKLPPMPREFVVDVQDVQKGFRQLGGRFRVHDIPHELYPGVWITGPIPRIHPERNWSAFMSIERSGELTEDTIPEDQALVIETPKGLVVVAGCGHAGIVNTLEYALKITEKKNVYAIVGGFHLMSATEAHLRWTGEKLREFGVEHILGAHCTGINAVQQLRSAGNYDRQTAVVGAVGSVLTLNGIKRGMLNR